MIPLIFIIIGSIVTVTAAFFDYRQKLNDKQEELDNEIKRNLEYQNLLSKSNDIIQKSNKIIESQQTVIDSSNKIIDLQNQLSERNDKIQDLQSSTLNEITGGKSIPKLFILPTPINIFIKVANDTDVPIRNISIQVTRIIDDYFTTDSAGVSNSNNTDAWKDWIFDVRDLSAQSERIVFQHENEKKYNDVSYIYKVSWLTGFYEGSFSIKSAQNSMRLSDSHINHFTKGLDLKKTVYVGGVNPDIYINGIKP
ncbi:DUF349 domain-containing protein [Mucilaginibacter gossypii]|uniref:Uncharacterized protein n=2 Tax=Mucilaginibacter TaxID=423349 RepID=A0A1G8JX40_9SPHI|nr:DUF349 domain-containing protein [Mucilaginibacter gossypii]SDI35749.1 hypothetical protein SAMN05192573_11971 [Mucilaginibacter gossypii]